MDFLHMDIFGRSPKRKPSVDAFLVSVCVCVSVPFELDHLAKFMSKLWVLMVRNKSRNGLRPTQLRVTYPLNFETVLLAPN